MEAGGRGLCWRGSRCSWAGVFYRRTPLKSSNQGSVCCIVAYTGFNRMGEHENTDAMLQNIQRHGSLTAVVLWEHGISGRRHSDASEVQIPIKTTETKRKNIDRDLDRD